MERDKKEAGSTLKGCGCNPGQRHWCDRCDIMRIVAAGWLAEGLDKSLERDVWSWSHVFSFKARSLGEVDPETYFTLDCSVGEHRASRTGAFERWVES